MSRTWFLTGASSGIGRELTRLLLGRGERVAATGLGMQALDAEAASAAGDALWRAELDVTRLDDIERVVEQAWQRFERIDVVVNSAGYGLVGAIEEMTDAQVRHQLDTNLLGAIRVTRAFLPRFRAQGGGHVVQISSSGGQRTAPGLTLYHASKWGLEAFSEGLAEEVRHLGISITIAEPGSTRTGWRENAIRTAPIAAYADTPGGAYQHGFTSVPAPGDPARMALAIVEAVGQTPPPRRLVLGSDAYELIHTALLERLAEVEAQAATAPLTDFPSD